MPHTHTLSKFLIVVLSVVLISPFASAGSPPSNTIPIIADRPNVPEVDLDTFLMLSWHYFDVLQAADYSAEYMYNQFIEPANETGMFLAINPAPTARWGHWPWSWAARMTENSFSDSAAYARPVWAGITVDGTTYTQDSLIKTFSAAEMKDSLEIDAAIIDSIFGSEEQVWY